MDLNHLSAMISALGYEIEAIKRRSRSKKIELLGGEFVRKEGEYYFYRFLFDEETNLRDDTPARIVIGKDEVDGMVVSCSEGSLIIGVEKDLGGKILRATLVVDDSFLVERLKDRLEKVRSGEESINLENAKLVIGEGEHRCGRGAIPDVCKIEESNLNEEQAEAIRLSLGSNIVFVWGPPGTGKTTTVARIVESHYRCGRSVLLVSNTNIAVDTALEKVADCLSGDLGFQQGAVIRIGPLVKDELIEKHGSYVILDRVVERLSVDLQREKTILEKKQVDLQSGLELVQDAIRRYQSIKDSQVELLKNQRERDRKLKNVDLLSQRLRKTLDSIEKIEEKIEKARLMSTLRRALFAGLKRKKRKLEVLKYRQRGEEEKLAEETSSLKSTQQTIDGLATKVMQNRAYLENRPTEKECRATLRVLSSGWKEVKQKLESVVAKLSKIRSEVSNRSRIIATTVYRTYLKGQVERDFDVVIIDEASMITLPMAYYAAGLSKQHVVVAGDFRQLPAIVMSDGADSEEWLKKDVFFKSGIVEDLEKGQAPSYLIALRQQYRMREQICGAVNKIFYHDFPLTSAPSAGRTERRLPLSDLPLLYVDTSSSHPWASVRIGTYSRYNLFHALLVRNIVACLDDKGYLPGESGENDALGVVSPYSAQTKLIQALLKDRIGHKATGIAATVHRFQGNEKETMLIDLTDSFGFWISKFMKATDIAEDGARLLNVALSRAKCHVVLIANFGFLRRKSPEGSYVSRLLDYFEENGKPLDVEDLLPLGDRDWVDALEKLNERDFDVPEGSAGIYNEGSFYPCFCGDLGSANKSIVVFSPYMTSRGTGRWVDYFRAAITKGVPVRLVTRPPGEFGGSSEKECAELIEELRATGVAVDIRDKMHEKIALIDGKVLWHGSLNILSHRDTTESMMRIKGGLACDVVSGFVSSSSSDEGKGVDISKNENPMCPNCGSHTIWKNGRYGVYFECEKECGGKVDQGTPRRKKWAARKKGGFEKKQIGSHKRQGSPCPKSGCSGRLVSRTGRYGPFLGCSRYPRCKYTENP